MTLVYGDGCTGTGWKEFPQDMTAKQVLQQIVDKLTDEQAEIFLIDFIQQSYDYVSDGDHCEQCGDTYYEYKLEIE